MISEEVLNPGETSVWIPVFVMFIIWGLTFIPRAFTSFAKHDDEAAKFRITKAHRAYGIARDGLLLLLTSVALAFALRANEDAIVVLSWIFLGVWTLSILTAYVTDSRILVFIMHLIGLMLILATIITSLASHTHPSYEVAR